MNSLKKLVVFSLACLMLPSAWADETVDQALVDMVYEAIDGKKVVIYNSSVPLYAELEKKAKEFEADTLFLDSQILNGLYNEKQLKNLQQIESLDSPELFLTALTNPAGFITHYFDLYGTENIALLEQYQSLCTRDYIPTVQGFSFIPIKKTELTKEYLNEAVILFNEFVKKYEEATVSIKTEEGEEIKRSEIDNAVRFHISNFSNILAWNATLIGEYETAGRLYSSSINYALNVSSLLSLASLSKEAKLEKINKEAVEKDLMTIAMMSENESFLELGFRIFYNGFIYGTQHYKSIKWDWIIFGIPQNSPEFKTTFNSISEPNKAIFENDTIPASQEYNTKLVSMLEKYKLPPKLSEYTPSNYFTLYSIIRNQNDKYGRFGRRYVISTIDKFEDASEKLKLRNFIEKAILYNETLALRGASEEYLNKYRYNRQVAIAALLAHSRLLDLQSQKVLLDKMIAEEGDKAPEWISSVNKAIEAALISSNINGFNDGCYNAIKSYKGNDAITIGYLYNLYSFSQLFVGGIKDPTKEKINFIDLVNGKIIKKQQLIEADMVFYTVGSYFIQQGETDTAGIMLHEAYSKNRYSQIYLNDLVVALTENGEYELGRDALKEHDKEIQSLDMSALDTLAVCIVRANPNDAQEALATLERANKIASDEGNENIPPELYLHFAEIYNILGKKDEAKKYLEKFNSIKLERELLNNDKEVLEHLKKSLQ